MEIKFDKVAISTFCGVKDKLVELGNKTIIKGVNKAGKTTLMNAIYWILFGKLADGSNADDKVRPHDENGNNIDFVDVSASLTLHFDDKEVTAVKTQKQNWVKDRTTQEQKFKGNVNEYEINGIPKKEKDFTDYISQFIDPEKFMFCINPKMFFNLDSKKRRAMLFSLVGDFTDADVIKANPRFTTLKNELMDGTVDELIARSKKAISALKDELKTIPARIDELSHQIVEINVAELTENRKALANALDLESKRLADADEANAESNAIAREISECQREMDDLKFKVERESKSTTDDLNWQIQQKIQENARLNSSIKNNESMAKSYGEKIEINNRELIKLREEWADKNGKTFDRESAKCPYCGAEYSKSKVDELETDFEKHKAILLGNITDNANGIKHKTLELEEEVQELNAENERLKKQIEDNNVAIEAFQEKLGKIETKDVTKTKDYKSLSKKITELTAKRSALTVVDKTLILNSINELNGQINDIDTRLAFAENNAKVQARIEELGEKQLDISQRIANQEQMLDLLSEYNRAKIGMLTDKINSYFNVIRWQMFKEQINGGFAEVCIPLVEGTSYDGLLNHGNKILAEIDLCKAFQKANNVVCPIIIDDSESLDEWRIPDIDSQLIVLRRTDDAELTVVS